MKFQEFFIYRAIRKVHRTIANPGSDFWTSKDEGRRALTAMLINAMTESVDDELIAAWAAYRKSNKVDGPDSCRKLDLLIEVAETHGAKCFYAGRGKGPCCDTMSLERLIPESRGGIYSVENCVIACKSHNTSRQDKTLEDFLSQRQD